MKKMMKAKLLKTLAAAVTALTLFGMFSILNLPNYNPAYPGHGVTDDEDAGDNGSGDADWEIHDGDEDGSGDAGVMPLSDVPLYENVER